MTELGTKKDQLAKLLGETDIKVVDPTGIHAMEMGVVVEIHIRRWRGRTRLDFSDLGLPRTTEDEIYSHLLRLGDKKLLPKTRVGDKEISYVDILDSLEARARRWLEVHSFDTHWGRFVPHTLYTEWKDGDSKLKTEYLGIRDEIDKKYDEIVSRLLTEYEAMAKAAYQRNQALRKQEVDEPKFVDRFMSHIEGLIPSPERIYGSFGYEVELKFVPLPSDFEKDIARADKVRRMETLKAEADMAKISSIRAMNDDVIRQVREKKMTLVDSFMTDITKQVRNMMYDTVTDVLNSIKKNDGKLVGKASTQLANLINSIEGLNFYGDRDVDAMMKRVKAQLGEPVKDRSVGEITETLKDIGTLTRANLISLGDSPRNGRAIGISKEPTETMVRKARRSLGIDRVTDRLETRQARLTPAPGFTSFGNRKPGPPQKGGS